MHASEDALASHVASIDIAAPPETIYAMVSDITRMGEWSPEAVGGRWLEGATGATGDWFVGLNETPERSWERECQVARAEPGVDFTFVVGGIEANCTWWSYEMEAIDEGTRLTERWWLVNKTPAMAAATPEMFEQRVAYTLEMLQQTLAAIKVAAES